MKRLASLPSARRVRAAAAALLACASLHAGPSHAQEPSRASDAAAGTGCPASQVIVRSLDPSDARSVCRGALAAIDFFRNHGVQVNEALNIEVVQELPAALDRSAVGCFTSKDRVSRLLSYQIFLKHRKWFDLDIGRRLYESVASHEAAHALAYCAAASRPLANRATEYIAAVTMLTTMDPENLNALLAAHPGIEFETEWEISELSYAFDPRRFSIMAYRHFQRLPDRAGFLQAILAGKELTRQYHYSE